MGRSGDHVILPELDTEPKRIALISVIVAVAEEGVNMVWRKELSAREREICNLVSRGRTNEQISKSLDISEPTVKTHLRNIYSKTDIHDRANLAIRVLNSDKT